MKSLLFILFLTLLFCEAKSQSTKRNATHQRTIFFQAVQRHLEYIDSIRRIDYDFIEAESKKLEQTLIKFRKEVFSLRDTLNLDWLYIVKSSDKQLCLVSWDTRMGGTMIEYATMALFKNSNGQILTKTLVDTSHSIENTSMHYDTIYTVHSGARNYYIAHGFGQGSTALPWQELRAFEIKNNLLTSPRIFPDYKPNIFVEFDTHEFGSGKRVPTIKVRNGGKTLLVPLATDKGGFAGKYQTFVLQGQFYKLSN